MFVSLRKYMVVSQLAQHGVRKRHKQTGDRALVKVKFIRITPEREIESAQAAIVSNHHRTGGRGHRVSRIKHTSYHAGEC